eukprot:GHVU01105058.1.p1 GENE.GHVU01105058.1~~GHVU01105058.1.p1  ORF type:complete len:137 (+),score=24.94 GHVU01105058.1:142-552(+)
MRQMHGDVWARGSYLASNDVAKTGERQPQQLQPVDEVESNRLHLGCGTSASGCCSTRDMYPLRRCGAVRRVASCNADLSLSLSAVVQVTDQEEVKKSVQSTVTSPKQDDKAVREEDVQEQTTEQPGTPQQVIVNLL